MANETRGILFEAIAEQAILKAKRIAHISGSLFWNEKPEAMSITPDFTIGSDKNSPDKIILVTASGSAKETDKKFWRNIGELEEVKSQISTTPTVISLYFKSVVKKTLAIVSEEVCDATLHIDLTDYHSELTGWVDKNIKANAKTKEAKRELLVKDIQSNSQLASAIASLAQDLADALQQHNKELEPLWALMKQDYKKPHHPPESKKTYIRRGLGKLMVIESKARQAIYQAKGKSIDRDLVPDYAYELRFSKKSLAGAHISDPEIKGALELLGGDVCKAVLQQAPKSMEMWINPLRDLNRVATHVDFVHNNYDQIIDPKGLEVLLVKCFNDPSDLSGEAGDEKVWIYEILVSLLKAKTGKKQGYGLAQLAEDTGLAETGEGAPLARFIIPKFTQREEFLQPQHLSMLAKGLSERFRNDVSRQDVFALKVKVEEWVIKENLEDRLIPYRNFEPLMWLLIAELDKQGKAYEAKRPYIGWINEYTAIGKKSATTPFVKVGSTLVHWKSSHGSHPNDKTKELSARARSVKYQYSTEMKQFSRRENINQLALIVDGDWTDRHLDTLSKSGWDIIVYPDQISDLVAKL